MTITKVLSKYCGEKGRKKEREERKGEREERHELCVALSFVTHDMCQEN